MRDGLRQPRRPSQLPRPLRPTALPTAVNQQFVPIGARCAQTLEPLDEVEIIAPMSGRLIAMDDLSLYGVTVRSRLLLGTALYPSPQIMLDAITASEADIVTVSLRRESSAEKSGQAFWSLLKGLDVRVLPNTAVLPKRQGGRQYRVHGARAVRHPPGSSWK